MGFDSGALSSSSSLILKDKGVHSPSQSWARLIITDATLAAAVLGTALGILSNEKWGRKNSVLTSDALFFIGALSVAFANHIWFVLIGRVLVGLGIGIVNMTTPIYVVEASPAKIRGGLVSAYLFMVNFGVFMAHLMDIVFIKIGKSWRAMFIGLALISAIHFIFMTMLCESPRLLWLLRKFNKAREALGMFNPPDEIDSELKALERFVGPERADVEVDESGFLSKLSCTLKDATVRKGLYMSVLVNVIEQIAGNGIILQCGPSVMRVSGFSPKDVGFILSLLTCLGLMFSIHKVDKLGSGKLMTGALSVMCVALLVLGVLLMHETKVGIYALIFILCYVISYSSGLVSTSWLIATEVFSLEHRTIGCGICAMASWVVSLAINNFFPSSTKVVKTGWPFLMFAGFLFLGLLAIYYMVPETKNMTLEEAGKVLDKNASRTEGSP